MSTIFVALDVETTGLDAARDQIIEIGAVRLEGDGRTETWTTLINPGCPIPPRITQLTGITDAMVASAPRLSMVTSTLRRFVGDAALVGHNIAFDIGFIHHAHPGLFAKNLAVDTFALAAIVLPRQRSYALGALAEALQVPLSDAHRALPDAQATANLFRALIQRAEETIPPSVIQTIVAMAERCRTPWPLRPVFQEIERRQARHAFVKAPPAKPTSRSPFPTERRCEPHAPGVALRKPPDANALARTLGPEGPIAASFAVYEHRPQQVEMMAAVAEALGEGHHLLVEAGTGTGKSLAYLLPAIRLAIDNDERVVVSTNTINLQDQLFTKDLPDLQRALGEEVRCALLKGRSNYLCPRRFEALCRQPELTIAEMDVIARVLAWLPVTTSGDQGELFLPTPEQRAVWNQIASEPIGCTAERCLREQKGRCFYYQAHQWAEAAHIIVVNHALLFSDIAAESRVLPEYTHLIIDEAHHLEEAATQQLSFTASAAIAEQLLETLYGPGFRPGLLDEVVMRVRPAVDPRILEAIEGRTRQIRDSARVTRTALELFFRAALDFFQQHRNDRNDGPYDARILLDDGLRHQPAWSDLEVAWDDANERLREVVQQLSGLATDLVELNDAEIPDLDELISNVTTSLQGLAEFATQTSKIISHPDANGIYWAEISARDAELSLKAAPLRVGPLIEQHLLKPKRAVVMTSATLRTAESFQYMRQVLNAQTAAELAVGSPFNYEEQTLLYLPVDMPEPTHPDYQTTIERTIIDLARATDGRLLALFTSYTQLKRTTEVVAAALGPEGFAIFSQGDGASRGQLLEGFRTTTKAVLLGTRSFWEGVDVVGEALSVLVLCRLPFAVPNDPIVQARSRIYDDPFNDYHVPEAILRFRQGFGRLIRSRQDTGVCVVLDRRVLTKSYGALFLKSLPKCYEMRWPLARLPEVAARWLARQRS